jgi:DNA modification methylase
MNTRIIHSDCKEAIKKLLAEGVQVDSIVTDPPYELGFMGKSWDSTGIAYDTELWNLCLQVLKPGGHLLAFSGSRTYHRMAVAIEDAGFEIRDQIQWIYGSGFPKSLNISKAIDKMAGAERDVVYIPIAYPDSDCWGVPNKNSTGDTNNPSNIDLPGVNKNGMRPYSLAASELAKQWDGWGSALKPAHEPIVLARKPLSEKNIAENVIKHGTGGINIDGCRISVSKNNERRYDLEPTYNKEYNKASMFQDGSSNKKFVGFLNEGRFPANVIHDGSDEVEAEFAKYGYTKDGIAVERNKRGTLRGGFDGGWKAIGDDTSYNGKGSASRFFYCAKASKKERNGSKHPTVKPINLMKYLCKLITPPNGTVLDPFAGSGTTGQAAREEGFNVILIEREAEYVTDINRRMEKFDQPFELSAI